MAKKTIFPEEIQSLIDEVEEKMNQEYHDVVVEEQQKRKGEWDVKKGEPISYFDPKLSYEHTGYKPITKELGLDFDPSWFTEARDNYIRTGHYTSYRFKTKANYDFWKQELIRCRDGMTVNGYTITGSNYFFLNYYQLPNVNTDKAGTSRANVFPQFLVYQYEFFHYFELCKILRKNACLMKSRGIGFSEINSALLANQYNSFQDSISMLTASTDNYVRKTLEKVWGALTFLNDHTDGGMRKLTQVVNTALKKRASHYKKVQGQDIEEGWMSQIEGVVADDDSKIRGARVDLLIFEEAGHNKCLQKSFVKGEALCSLGGKKFAVMVAGGTGGDSGPNMEGLRLMYYNPETYDILPYKHNCTPDGSEVITSFFIPAYASTYDSEYLDKRGCCDKERLREYFEKERSKRAANPQALIDYSAEFCFCAEEAFSLEGDNKFNKVNITEQLTRIRALKQCPEIDSGKMRLVFKNDNKKVEGGNITDILWQPVKDGKIRILEHPMWLLDNKVDDDGHVIWSPPSKMNDLYVAGVDGIDMGAAETSEYTKDASDFCMVILRRSFGTSGPQVVAIYKDRPNDIHEAYHTCIALAMYYNCKINVEKTRLSFLTWARSNRFLNYFMRRPSATYSDITKRKVQEYGTPATLQIIDHQTDLIRDFVETYYDGIWFEDMLDELNRYTIEKKRNFDIVAALGMVFLADEEMSGVVPKSSIIEEVEMEDIGYYYDEKGYKRYGIIPKNDNNKFQTNYNTNFYKYENYSGTRTSNPRYYM